MRGQFSVIIPAVQVPTTETSVAGIIVPANTLAQINRIEMAGAGITANNAVRLRIQRFTGNTPTLSNAVTPKPKVDSNILSASLSWGGRGGTPYNGNVWSVTPTTPQADIFDDERNLYGGGIKYQSTLQEALDIGGQTAATYYDIRAVAGTQVNCSLLFVFTE
jgi:hypothetical protein